MYYNLNPYNSLLYFMKRVRANKCNLYQWHTMSRSCCNIELLSKLAKEDGPAVVLSTDGTPGIQLEESWGKLYVHTTIVVSNTPS